MVSVEEAFEMVSEYVKIPRMVITDREEVEWNIFPAVVKPATFEHKTEKGLVYTNILDKDGLRKALKRVLSLYEKAIVQEQIRGLELILGMKREKGYGDVLMLGYGGVMAEVMNRFEVRLVPLNGIDVWEMIEDLNIPRVFRGMKLNIEDLVSSVVAFSRFVEHYKPSSAEINPLMLNEKGAFAVDVRIMV